MGIPQDTTLNIILSPQENNWQSFPLSDVLPAFWVLVYRTAISLWAIIKNEWKWYRMYFCLHTGVWKRCERFFLFLCSLWELLLHYINIIRLSLGKKYKFKTSICNIKIDSPIVVITVPEKNKDPVNVHFSSHPLVYPQLSASVMTATNSFITSLLMLYLINMRSTACFAFSMPSCSLCDSSCLKTNIPMAR